MDAGVCMAESLCCSPETGTTLLISCAPTQNENLKKKKEGMWASEGTENVWAAVLYYFMFAGYCQIPEIFGGALEEFKSLKLPLHK